MTTERAEKTPVRGAYIHIPFCDHICYYCDFNKFFMKNQPVDAYLEALNREMAYYAGKGPVQTIYIGGGTPTALSDSQFERMLKDVCGRFMNPAIKEFTVEANPENLSDEKLQAMKSHGVTRLSIGVQSFDDRLLQSIGRAHVARDAKRAVQRAKAAGFDNITLDLMFALPGQTESILHQSLAEALELETPHISIYSLQVEPKTIFYNRLKSGKLSLPGEDLEADMYGQIIFELEKHGLQHYEISNFARPGYEGVHNSLYWQNEEYYGIGAGAHGYVDHTRYANAGPIKNYLAAVERQSCGRNSIHPVTEQERIEEEMFLGLRLMQGVSKKAFFNKFGRSMESIYGQQIEKLKKQGLLEEFEDRIKLSTRGIFLGNNVFEAFLLS
ncbi:MAG: radical SAM family heme chaperone HemW [Sporolactobacillus sp.]